MKVDVSIFGQLTDITGSTRLEVNDVPSTGQLIRKLQSEFPGLRGKTYVLAVNQEIVRDDTPLRDGYRVSLLPPFSGG